MTKKEASTKKNTGEAQSNTSFPAIVHQCESAIKLISEKLDNGQISSEGWQEIKSSLLDTACALEAGDLLCGYLFATEIIEVIEFFSLGSEAMLSATLRSALIQFGRYLQRVNMVGQDVPAVLLWPMNELRAVRKMGLLSSSVFCLPEGLSARNADDLVAQCLIALPATEAVKGYADFNRSIAAVIDNENQAEELQRLSAIFLGFSVEAKAEYARVLWTICSVFTDAAIALQAEGVSLVVKRTYQQINEIVENIIVDDGSQLLSVDGSKALDRTLCDMLVYIGLNSVEGEAAAELENKFQQRQSLFELNQIVDSSQSGHGEMLVCGVRSGFRLIATTKLLIDTIYAEQDKGRRAAKSERASGNLSLLADVLGFLSCPLASQQCRLAKESFNGFVGNPESKISLVRCATLLMIAEKSMLTVHSALLEPIEGEESSLENDDDLSLDELLVRELCDDFQPVKKGLACSGFSPEWLVALLKNTSSLSTYLSDSFLGNELCAVVESLSNSQCDITVQADLLVALADAICEYLSAYAVFTDRVTAQKEVSLAVTRLQNRLLTEDKKSRATDKEEEKVLNASAIELDVSMDVWGAMTDKTEVERGDNLAVYSASIHFGNECNTYVDIIQQALDTALGSSGNLAPDKTVVNALENLHTSVAGEGLIPLLNLIEPLSLVIEGAEASGRTLSQADTLLVQESIVAITLGIDSLVNQKLMPELIVDVTARIAAIAADGKHRLRGDVESAGLIDVFVEEAEELLQRLFELLQRWRGAPQGGSKLQGDISRLLHTLKGSADTVGLAGIANLVHSMETSFLGLRNSEVTPSSEFFELILEAVESLNDDVDRIRNAEQQTDHAELVVQLLDVASEIESDHSDGASVEYIPASVTDFGSVSASTSSGFTAELDSRRVPVFGSAKYFFALESSRKLINRNHSEGCSLLDEFRQHSEDLGSVLQSVQHLRARPSELNAGLVGGLISPMDKSIDESLSDLELVQRKFESLLSRVSSNVSKQTSALDSFNALVSTADMVSVAGLRARLESIVRHSAMAANKPVEIELMGGELQIERRLYSDLLGPLEQLLVNAVVHGVESEERRQAAGKKLYGTIKVEFTEIAGDLVLTVEDNGAGVDVEQLRSVISERKGVNVSNQSDAQLLGYLTEQEVSTALTADLSAGRGVGLDIVREVLFRYCGTLEVVTTRGIGTVFKLKLPLHSFSQEVLLVESGGQYFAIPYTKIVEIQASDGGSIPLSRLLGLEDSEDVRSAAVLKCRILDSEQLLRVDSVIGRRVAKFSNRKECLLMAIPAYLGSTVIEGQRVIFLLDLDHLFRNDESNKPAGNAVASSQTVLIVDDSVTVRASFGRALVGKAYQIILARNGLEALEVLEKTIPDAIILDLEMPKMNGFELAERIRADDRLAGVPVIVVTSRPRASISDWLNKIEAQMYFEKPCSEGRLGRAVAELLVPVPT